MEICVIDTGCGLSAADQEKLFRIDVDVRTIGISSEKGTGLKILAPTAKRNRRHRQSVPELMIMDQSRGARSEGDVGCALPAISIQFVVGYVFTEGARCRRQCDAADADAAGIDECRL